jgi:murein DD-endopeptidase MepM/ murein hydrolase activator NlpD
MAPHRRKEKAQVMLARCTIFMFVGSALAALAQRSEPLNLALPTDNDAIYRSGGSEFYQYIIREFEGARTTPWEGGQYGFVRNPQRTGTGLRYTRFHEGIDIRPLRRDARGNAADEVRAIASGRVVHVSLVPGHSSYGNYVVVEHRWDGSPYYSLYAHLASASVRVGQQVEREQTLGIMGHTGSGLDRERAHLHLELNLLLSTNFEQWHSTFFKGEPNRHGIYNGINLTGLDIAKLYLELRRRPGMSIPQFLESEETFYRVAVPASPNFQLPKRYPWMLPNDPSSESSPAAWEVSFSRSGIPLKVRPHSEAVSRPQITWVKRGADLAGATRGVIGGTSAAPRLTPSGERLMRLLTFPD